MVVLAAPGMIATSAAGVLVHVLPRGTERPAGPRNRALHAVGLAALVVVNITVAAAVAVAALVVEEAAAIIDVIRAVVAAMSAVVRILLTVIEIIASVHGPIAENQRVRH